MIDQSKPIPSKLKPTTNLRFSFGLKYHIGCLQRTNKAFKYCAYCYLKLIHINFKLDQNKAKTLKVQKAETLKSPKTKHPKPKAKISKPKIKKVKTLKHKNQKNPENLKTKISMFGSQKPKVRKPHTFGKLEL